MKTVTLREITLNITDGKHGDCEPAENSGYYFVSCKDVNNGTVDYANARQISERAFLETHKRTQLEPNDILITNSGTIGRMALVKDIPETYRTTFQKSVAIVKPDTSVVLPTYLYYKLQNCVTDFVNRSNGSAQKNLLLGTMREFKIDLHEDFAEQERLSSILASYDNLIENNQKQIKLLEEAAQRLYKEWFVDFHFPGYEDTPIVDGVPEGWKKGTLGDISLFKRGKTITKAQVLDGDVPVVAGGIEPAYYHNKSNTVAPVITVSGSGANAGFTRLYNVDVFASDCSFIDSNSTPFLFFVYCFLKANAMKLDSLQKGSAQPHVYAKDLNALVLSVPTEGVLTVFCDIVFPYFERIRLLQRENEIAAEARDRLLPKLMSGEIEV